MTILSIILSVVTFSQFTMREGLSQNTVFSISQDKDKNIWVATYDGINRFDGYNFKVYHPERDPDFVQEEGADQRVYTDSKGRIWAYDGGLSRYDPENDRFVPLEDKVRGAITSFIEIPGGPMLVAADGMIVQLDLNSGIPIAAAPFYSGGEATVMAQGFGLLAVGTRSGKIIVFKTDGYTLVAEKSVCPESRIGDIIITSENEIWAAASGGHIIRYDIEDDYVRDYSSDGSIRVISSVLGRDRQDRIVVLTRKGIYAYEKATDCFVFSFSPPDNPITLKCIFRDSEGDIWLGSYYKGLYYCHLDDSPFERISLDIPADELQICSIGESTDGKIWICSLGQGTYIYDPESRNVERVFIHPDPSDNAIKNFVFSKDGRRVWFGLGRGLSEYNLQTGQHTVYSGGEYPHSIYSVAVAGEHELWIGTLAGIYVFDTISKAVRKIESSGNMFIYKLYEDNKNRLWVASESGLYCASVTRDAEGFITCSRFNKESEARDVHDILQSGEKLIVAARNGLYIRNKAGEWTHYDRQSGLSSNFINGIETDFSGTLWVGTEYGLNRFNPSTKEFSRYFKDDGVGIDYFAKNAHCLASDGTVYYGGIGGLVRIDPVPKVRMQESSNPRITDFIVNGKHQPFEKNNLNYKENSIIFFFSVTNFSSRQKNLFRYRLCGAEQDWRISESPYSDTYTSLRPGKYRLELRSYNIAGEESHNLATYSFVIRPPWWASKLALLIYFLLSFSLIGFIVWRIDLNNKRRAQAEIDRITKFSQEGIDRLTVLHYTKDPVSPEDAAFVLKAVRTMEKNLPNDAYGVEQLADDLCMSRSNLYLKIKKLTGDSALQFVHKIRLEKACELLRSTELSIADIAHEAGFGSSAYFCTCFKREKGTTPNQWRQM